MIKLDSKTVISLKLELLCNDILVGTGTGYFEQVDSKYYLVSNYHIFSGRDPFTDKAVHKDLALPDKIRVYCHKSGQLGNFIPVDKELYDKNKSSIYKVHSQPKIDVAVLPFDNDNSIDIYPIEPIERLSTANVQIYPSRKITIIGFPYGLTSNAYFPIWKTGNIASEVDLPFLNSPCFSIDAATRGGMSGSPVYAIIEAPYHDKNGQGSVIAGGAKIVFMGTYSGRMKIPQPFLNSLNLHDQTSLKQLGSDLGLCWYEKNTNEIICNGKHRNFT